MRLLNVHSFNLREFNSNIPEYVVTSHRWTGDEATYKDVLKRKNTTSKGYLKIQRFCQFVANSDFSRGGLTMKYDWIWVDTCCINKDSSAEVSESINSMCEWYRSSRCCIAYLADVRPISTGLDTVLLDFKQSEWFRRGWTLQELLAPGCVVFLTREWEVFGYKDSRPPIGGFSFQNWDPDPNRLLLCDDSRLLDCIATATSIPKQVLLYFKSRRRYSNDEKLSWSNGRTTTKPEDIAYCMLGIFDVHLPLIYGEGEKNALRRLHEEIEKKSNLEQREHAHRQQNYATYSQLASPGHLAEQHRLELRKQQRGRAERVEHVHYAPSLQREPTRTISPKDAVLDYPDTEQQPLF